jgi:hypothetical protein
MLSDDERHREREEAEVLALLRQLDHPAPRIAAGAVARQAQDHVSASRWQRWAAGIVLVACLGGIAYAMPKSRFPAWVRSFSAWIERRPGAAVPDSGPVHPPAETSIAGIAVTPGRKLVIVFTTSAPESQARIALSDDAEVVVRAPQGAATFASDADRLVIDNRGPASSFEIEIPRSAPWVEISVRHDRIYLKDGDRHSPSPPAAGGYTTPLAARE